MLPVRFEDPLPASKFLLLAFEVGVLGQLASNVVEVVTLLLRGRQLGLLAFKREEEAAAGLVELADPVGLLVLMPLPLLFEYRRLFPISQRCIVSLHLQRRRAVNHVVHLVHAAADEFSFLSRQVQEADAGLDCTAHVARHLHGILSRLH